MYHFWEQPIPVNITGGSFTVDPPATQTVNDGGGSLTVDAASLPLPSGAASETTLAALNTKTPALGQAAMAASTPVVLASNQSAVPVSGPLTDAQLRAAPVAISGNLTSTPQASTLCVTATAAISTGVTATLPAVAGQFHYITAIDVVSYAGATIATAATAVNITTTNLPGSPVFNHQRLHTAGQSFQSGMRLANPLKSSVANTATTVVCPVLTGCIWRVTVYYYAAA